MKIYLASNYSTHAEMRERAKELEALGHTVTSRRGKMSSRETVAEAVKIEAVKILQEYQTLKTDVERFRLTLETIRRFSQECSPVDLQEWLEAICGDALEGLMPECPKCGTYVHEGACVFEDMEEQ